MIDNIFPVLLFRHPDHAGAFLSLLADAQYQQFPVFAPGIYLVLRLAGSAGKKLRMLPPKFDVFRPVAARSSASSETAIT